MANSINKHGNILKESIINHLYCRGKTLQNKKTVIKKNPIRYHPEKETGMHKKLGGTD